MVLEEKNALPFLQSYKTRLLGYRVTECVAMIIEYQSAKLWLQSNKTRSHG